MDPSRIQPIEKRGASSNFLRRIKRKASRFLGKASSPISKPAVKPHQELPASPPLEFTAASGPTPWDKTGNTPSRDPAVFHPDSRESRRRSHVVHSRRRSVVLLPSNRKNRNSVTRQTISPGASRDRSNFISGHPLVVSPSALSQSSSSDQAVVVRDTEVSPTPNDKNKRYRKIHTGDDPKNPFIKNDGDLERRRESNRRTIKAIDARTSIGYTSPVVPKRVARVVASDPEPEVVSSPEYNRQPSYRWRPQSSSGTSVLGQSSLPAQKESIESFYKKPFHEQISSTSVKEDPEDGFGEEIIKPYRFDPVRVNQIAKKQKETSARAEQDFLSGSPQRGLARRAQRARHAATGGSPPGGLPQTSILAPASAVVRKAAAAPAPTIQIVEGCDLGVSAPPATPEAEEQNRRVKPAAAVEGPGEGSAGVRSPSTIREVEEPDTLARLPTPVITRGGKVASLRARFDTSITAAPAAPAASAAPTTGPASLRSTAPVTTASTPGDAATQVNSPDSNKGPVLGELVPSTPSHAQKFLRRRQGEVVLSPGPPPCEWGTPPEAYPDLIPKPLFSPRSHRTPVFTMSDSPSPGSGIDQSFLGDERPTQPKENPLGATLEPLQSSPSNGDADLEKSASQTEGIDQSFLGDDPGDTGEPDNIDYTVSWLLDLLSRRSGSDLVLPPNIIVDQSFLGDDLTSPTPIPKMDRLTTMSAASNRQRAQEDARSMQKKVIDMSEREGKVPPNYFLMELIGKGSFGRVYKGKHMATAKVVAIKIIDIDASDFSDQSARSNTFNDFMKEVNALKILGSTKAKNINNVIEALSVGKTMWMVSEYCAGGSVATLMRPTRGLKENWIIPILREVVVALKAVHNAGIIHRDIKCANVLITEDGAVQLCDFGVAGMTETKLDKRSTFIGTPHWMPPELFEQSPSYGKEVDIWAFGSMAFEMATGLPPNAKSGVPAHELGSLFKQHLPRLEGEAYSEGLRAIVEYCLVEKPSDRPDIDSVEKHFYIAGTEADYPTSSLIELVKAFKKWEDRGGSRQSLFYRGGARGPDDIDEDVEPDNSWNFSTTDAFDEVVDQRTDEQDIIRAYGSSVNLMADFSEETSKPDRQPGRERGNRRRPPPEALAPLKAPIEKLFDQNTIHSYAQNSEAHYLRQGPPRPQELQTRSDLPLRDETARLSINESIIDLGEHDPETGVSSFHDADTIKPGGLAVPGTGSDNTDTDNQDFNRPALSDPADASNKRATKEWRFPVMAPPPASANAEGFRFPPLQRPNVTPGAGGRPTLHHHPTEPISVPTQGFNNLAPFTTGSPSRLSLIDLDMSIVEEPSRPSTADSSISNDLPSANPFHLERHASLNPAVASNMREREPSIYVATDMDYTPQSASGNGFQDYVDQSDLSDAEGGYDLRADQELQQDLLEDGAFTDFDFVPEETSNDVHENSVVAGNPHDMSTLPAPPSQAVLTGTATDEETASEFHRLIHGFGHELAAYRAEAAAKRRNGS